METPQSDGPDDPALFRRMLDFAYALEFEAAELVEPFEGGHAVINPSAPLLWDASYLVVEEGRHTAEQLEGIAERILGAHGLRYAAVDLMDPAEAKRLEPSFRELRWEVDRSVYMAHARAPDRKAEVEVEEASLDQTLELRRAVLKEAFSGDYAGDQDEVADQLFESDRAVAAAGGDRWFVAWDHGRVAACCSLLARGGVGQVETVLTSRDARNRGLGRAVALAAVEASTRDGNELTFIGADADDWPRLLYQRLGFDPVGVQLTFSRRSPA